MHYVKHEYKIGDLIGSKIDKVVRRNVTPKSIKLATKSLRFIFKNFLFIFQFEQYN